MPANKGLKDQVGHLLATTNLTAGEIARRLGCTQSNVSQIARRRGVSLLDNARDFFIAVPAWAQEVAEDYRDHARLFGEHEAARHCRRLIAEGKREEARAA